MGGRFVRVELNSYAESIETDAINELPVAYFEGKIKLIENRHQVENALIELSHYTKVGIDSETKPSFKKGVIHAVSLLQISTEDTCYLFRLNKIGMPDNLKHFLENDKITKIGLSLGDDMRAFNRLRAIKPKGFLDLQQMVRDFGISDQSLKKISAIVLGVKISKSQRLTNWEVENLTEPQQRYAATDAWVCLEIYNHLINNSKKN